MRRKRNVLIVVAAVIAVTAGQGRAAAYKWLFGGTNDWEISANWHNLDNPSEPGLDDGTVPDFNNDSVLITGAGTPDPKLTLDHQIGAVTLSASGDLFLDNRSLTVQLNSGLSGTTTIDGPGSSLNVQTGVLDTDYLTINSGGVLLMSTGGRAQVDFETSIAQGASFVGAGTFEAFTGAGDIVNDGTIRASGGTLIIRRTGADPEFDWDGDGMNGAALIVDDGATMQIDIPINNGGVDRFNGTITVNRNSEFQVNSNWGLGEALASLDQSIVNLNGDTGTATISGTGTITMNESDSRINVNSGTGRITSDMTVNDGMVAYDAGTTVQLDGTVSFTDGSQLKQVTVGLLGPYTTLAINGKTSISSGIFDWDNGFPTYHVTTIGPVGELLIAVERVNSTNNIYGGTINNSGTLDVSVAASEWYIDGELNFTGGTVQSADDDRMLVRGSVNATSGQNVVDCKVDFESGSNLTVSGGATTLLINDFTRVESGSHITVNAGALKFNGNTTLDGPATVSGAGEIEHNGFCLVTADTTIDVAIYDWDGAAQHNTTVNDGVTFTVNSEIAASIGLTNDPHGGIVAVRPGATLVVNDPTGWGFSSGGVLNLVGETGIATVEGAAAITSAGTILAATGEGVIKTDVTATAGWIRLKSELTFLNCDVTVNPAAELDFWTGDTVLNVSGPTVPNTATLTTNQSVPLDWDGPVNEVNQVTNIARYGTMTINCDLADDYDGTINLIGDLVMNCPSGEWNSTGLIRFSHVAGVGVGELKGTSRANVYGALEVSQTAGVIHSPIDFEAGSTVTVNTIAIGFLNLFNQTNYLGTTITGTGNMSQTGDATVTGDNTITLGGAYDLDGALGTSEITINDNSHLAIGADSIDHPSGPSNFFEGTLNFGTDSDLTINTTAGVWTHAGVINVAGTQCNYSGDDIIVTGDINVATGAEMNVTGNVTFESTANVVIANASGELALWGDTVFRGGSYRGSGELEPNGFTVETDTTVETGLFDWDGGLAGLSVVSTINPGVEFTIKSTHINSDFAPLDTFTGTVNVLAGAKLNVVPPNPWHMQGAMNLTGGADVNGKQMIVEERSTGAGGEILVTGPGLSRILCPVIFESTADVTVNDGLSLENDTVYRGGTYTGVNLLAQGGVGANFDVEASTTISTSIFDWDQGNNLVMTIHSGSVFTFDGSRTGSFDDLLVMQNMTTLNMNGMTQTRWTNTGTVRLLGLPVATPQVTVGGTDDVLNEGLIEGNGVFAVNLTNGSGGVITPGQSAGTLVLRNVHYAQHSRARLEMEIAGTKPVAQYDQLRVVGGKATLDGQLSVLPIRPYVDPAVRGQKDDFTLITSAQRAGVFNQVTYGGAPLVPTFGPDPTGSFRDHIGEGLFRCVTYTLTEVQFRNLLALPGDTDGDLDVDITDFNTLATNFDPGGANTPNEWTVGNFDGDGDIDITDFNNLATNFAPGGYDGPVAAVTADANPGEVDLIVDLATGEIILDGNAASISGLQVFSAGNSLLATDFTAEVLQFVISTNASTYAEGAFVNTNVDGQISLGILYDLLVNAHDLTFEYTMIGQPTVTGNVVYVPEPATLVLLATGGLLLIRRRRVA